MKRALFFVLSARCFLSRLRKVGTDWDKMKNRGVGKPGKLSEHFSSKAHKASLSDYVQVTSNNSHIDTLLDKEILTNAIQIEEDTENNRSVIKIIIDLYRTMARQVLALLSRHCSK